MIIGKGCMNMALEKRFKIFLRHLSDCKGAIHSNILFSN
ncbi:hypothetical protein AIOL_002129 [Candidatus Rhodobacter oscarellae]|uniref:Uncharacterized protein n=1 Tax=Candidatus Rhodobacter oscarellae TaxID=1675527 RepID=A0A0J9GUC1_9RHOB|nr:hypothetical protein AIOL_002129 [Candidatus Rhodobacter lobularis]